MSLQLQPEACHEEDTDDIAETDAASVDVRHLSVAPCHHGMRVDKVLVELAPEFSRSYLQQLLAQGFLTVNDRVVIKPAQKVQVLDQLQISLQPTLQSQAFRPEAISINVVFEDDHLMVVNKPAGMVVHPAPGNWSGTLLNALLGRNAAAHLVPRAGIVHRLDKDTSGLMVVAKDRSTMDALVKMMAQRSISRKYVALANNAWSGSVNRSVNAPIGRDVRQRLRMAVVDLSSQAGKEARTDIHCLDSVGNHCWVRCTLHTGRTHQIRVHMAFLGHPLVCDKLYGGASLDSINRQALHAYRLAFEHPVTHEAMEFHASLPQDIVNSLQYVGINIGAQFLD